MPLYGSVDLSMAQAPSGSRGTSPTEGQLYYDTDDNALYAYSGTSWLPVSAGSATGGTVTDYSGYKIHTFLLADSGNDFVVTGGTLLVWYLVIGGGAGGG